jgi:2-polyprenyl-3-methyl-5-hydroxy-6-metoxy-1,4-benzoquinol methylase
MGKRDLPEVRPARSSGDDMGPDEGRGDARETLEALWNRVRANTDDSDAWIAFSDALAAAEFDDDGDPGSLGPILLACFIKDDLDHQRLARAVFAVLRATPSIAVGLNAAGGVVEASSMGNLFSALNGALPLLVLRRIVLPFPSWERLIRAVRSELLRLVLTDVGGALEGRTSRGPPASLISAIAEQAYLNGYAMHVSPEEATQVKRLVECLSGLPEAALGGGEEGGLQWPPDVHQRAITMVAAYAPIPTWADLDRVIDLAHAHSDADFVSLLVQQVEAPLAEEGIRDEIRALTKIGGGVSEAVRHQYEEHPYPRWSSLPRPTPVPLPVRLANLFPGQPGLETPTDRPAHALIAGCGTGRQVAAFRARYTGVEVLAVDLSRSSLAYAARKLGELGLDDVTLAQADILELAGWDQRFDWIECTGVLHHMEEPRAGAAVLAELLMPGAVMKLALYSETARSGVVALRERIAKEGRDATAESIRAFRTQLLAEQAEGSTAHDDVLEWPDFYFMEECRDLLFHVQEHRFTIAGIGELIGELELEFMGFEVQAEVRRRFMEAHPAPGALHSLAAWDAFEVENPRTFRGMYQFWVRKPRTPTG